MEVQRKPGEEVSEKKQDRISQLPDELIHHIFSYINSREVVQTSILAKRWKNLWTTLTCLNFKWDSKSDAYMNDDRHIFVDNFLKNRNQQSATRKVTMLCYYKNTKLLDYAISHNVEHLDVASISGDYAGYPCVTSATIKTICLRFVNLNLTGWTLPSLISLHMTYVKFDKRISISGFQNLKELALAGCYKNKIFTINCPNLQSLTLTLFDGGKFVVSAPYLSYFKLYATDRVPGFSAENIFPSIKQVDINMNFIDEYWDMYNIMNFFNNMLDAAKETPLLKLSRKTIQVLQRIPDLSVHQPCPLCNLKLLYLQGQGLLCEKPVESTDRVIKYLLTNSPCAEIIMGN